MRVVIADCHEVVRVGLRVLLQCSEGDTIVGEASSGVELLNLLASCPCELLILDFAMSPDDTQSDGLYLLRKLRKHHPELAVVVLTTLRSVALFRAMYAEGVRAVVEKSAGLDELAHAIGVVGAGSTYIGELMSRKLAEDYALVVGRRPTPGDKGPALSFREAEVVHLLAQGLSVSNIARNAGLSIKTISRQKRSAMHKLGLTTNRHLFEYAIISGLQKL